MFPCRGCDLPFFHEKRDPSVHGPGRQSSFIYRLWESRATHADRADGWGKTLAIWGDSCLDVAHWTRWSDNWIISSHRYFAELCSNIHLFITDSELMQLDSVCWLRLKTGKRLILAVWECSMPASRWLFRFSQPAMEKFILSRACNRIHVDELISACPYSCDLVPKTNKVMDPILTTTIQ